MITGPLLRHRLCLDEGGLGVHRGAPSWIRVDSLGAAATVSMLKLEVPARTDRRAVTTAEAQFMVHFDPVATQLEAAE